VNQVEALETPLPLTFPEEVKGPDGTARVRTWNLAVHPRTFEMESLFTLWLEERELAFVLRHRGRFPVAELRELIVACARDAACGAFEFTQPRVQAALWTDAGFAYNAYLQLKPSDSAVTLPLVERIMKDPAKGTELAEKVNRANDPNPVRPAEATPPPATSPPQT
jgi:hypothetical protein